MIKSAFLERITYNFCAIMPKKKQNKTSPFLVPFPDNWDSRTRIDLTFNLGSAIRYHRETTVPEIGGLRFVRQASWGVAGIQLATSSENNKKRYRAHEIANAIEALGSKIHFIVECKCNKEQYKYLGSRAFGNDSKNDSMTFSFQCLRKPSYYVQNTYRQTIVTALNPLKLCKDSSLFDQMNLDENGIRLYNAFLGDNEISNCRVDTWLKNWIFKDKNYNVESKPYAKIFSPKNASEEEKRIIRDSLDCAVSLEFDKERRKRLIKIMKESKPHNEEELMNLLRQKGENGSLHALQIQDAINFNEMRDAAINLLQACAMTVKENNGRNGYSLKVCASVDRIKDKLDVLKKKSENYLNGFAGHKKYGEEVLEPAKIFANNAIRLDASEFLEFLIKQEQGIMDVSDGKIIALSLFDKFLKRNEDSSDNEANSEDNDDLSVLEDPQDSWKLSRLQQWQSLYDDAFGGMKYE